MSSVDVYFSTIVWGHSSATAAFYMDGTHSPVTWIRQEVHYQDCCLGLSDVKRSFLLKKMNAIQTIWRSLPWFGLGLLPSVIALQTGTFQRTPPERPKARPAFAYRNLLSLELL